jgi:hypothetical protein
MQCFWDQYTTDEAERAQITASPLRATCNAQDLRNGQVGRGGRTFPNDPVMVTE